MINYNKTRALHNIGIKLNYYTNEKRWLNYSRQVLNDPKDMYMDRFHISLLYDIVTHNRKLNKDAYFSQAKILYIIPKSMTKFDYKNHLSLKRYLTPYIKDYARYVLPYSLVKKSHLSDLLRSGYGRASKKEFIKFIIIKGYYKQLSCTYEYLDALDHIFRLKPYSTPRKEHHMMTWDRTHEEFYKIV